MTGSAKFVPWGHESSLPPQSTYTPSSGAKPISSIRAFERSDHHGGVVEHLDELEEALAAPALHVPPGVPVLVA